MAGVKSKTKVQKTIASDLDEDDKDAVAEFAKRLYADRAFRIEHMITIPDKRGVKVPFKLWPHQKKVLRHMGPGLVTVVVKGRSMGITTVNLADKLAACRLFENRECLILNKDQTDAKTMFARVRELDRDLPPDFQGEKYHNTGMLLHYADTNCVIRIDTAGQTESVTERKARSSTPWYVVITEAHYIKLLAKLVQGVVTTPEGEIVIESTSKGPRGAYAKLAMDTWQKGEQIDVNVRRFGPLVVVFCSALEQVDKRVPLEPGEVLEVPADKEEAARETAIRLYGQGQGFKPPEIEEFLKWRRFTIARYLNDKDRKTAIPPHTQFMLENPVEFADAFADTGSNYFVHERLMAIKALVVSEKLEARRFGILRRHGQEPELVAPTDENTVTIWTGKSFVGLPVDGYANRYLVFADVGEGKPDSNADAVYVFDHLRYCIVAAAYGRMGPELTAQTMMNLGDLYHQAWISWDCSGIGKELRPHFKAAKYKNLCSSREVDNPLVESDWLGVQWNRSNRHDALELLRKMWQNQEMTIPDLEAYEESKQFGYDEGEEFPRAAEGFLDDRIMSLAGLVFQNQFIPPVSRLVAMKPFDQKKPLLERLRRHRQDETKPVIQMLDEE